MIAEREQASIDREVRRHLVSLERHASTILQRVAEIRDDMGKHTNLHATILDLRCVRPIEEVLHSLDRVLEGE